MCRRGDRWYFESQSTPETRNREQWGWQQGMECQYGSQTFFKTERGRPLVPAESCIHTQKNKPPTISGNKSQLQCGSTNCRSQKSIEEKGLVPARAGGPVVLGRVTWWRQPPLPTAPHWSRPSDTPPQGPSPEAAAPAWWLRRTARPAGARTRSPGRPRRGPGRGGPAGACPCGEGHSPTCRERLPAPSWWGAT